MLVKIIWHCPRWWVWWLRVGVKVKYLETLCSCVGQKCLTWRKMGLYGLVCVLLAYPCRRRVAPG
jgi:hypothetical protein